MPRGRPRKHRDPSNAALAADVDAIVKLIIAFKDRVDRLLDDVMMPAIAFTGAARRALEESERRRKR